ncbi:MAG: thioredoxin-dependent thiol peroxidase [Hyphomonas sp.]
MNDKLTIGDAAPEFDMETTQGQRSLESYKGRYLVVYFYPKDSTPGCTTEAQDFSALTAEFNKLGADILGVSKDSMKRHENFTAKNELTFPLGVDANGDVCDAYGVWAEKKLYGKVYMGIVRATFLIAPNQSIIKIWPKVKVKGHANEVLDYLKNQ